MSQGLHLFPCHLIPFLVSISVNLNDYSLSNLSPIGINRVHHFLSSLLNNNMWYSTTVSHLLGTYYSPPLREALPFLYSFKKEGIGKIFRSLLKKLDFLLPKPNKLEVGLSHQPNFCLYFSTNFLSFFSQFIL